MPSDAVPALVRAEIDGRALVRNVRRLRQHDPDGQPVGVVKADAYGHGATFIARRLMDEGIEWLAVSTVAEAVALREDGITARLLVLGAPLTDHLSWAARYDLDLTVSSPAVADAVAASGLPLRVHAKVDTGMHRLGIAPEAAPSVVRGLQRTPGVSVEALWTHFATADGPDVSFVYEQLRRFTAVLDALGADAPPVVHTDNGPASIRHLTREALRGRRRLIRFGGVLYGMSSDPSLDDATSALEPVMRLVTRVVHVQTVVPGESVSYGRTWSPETPRCVATLAGGYGDGLPRAMQRGATVGIGGRRVPVVGRVCMDMLMVDLGVAEGPAGDVRVGDDAVLWGRGGPPVETTALACGTMPYELTCGLTSRVVRVPVG